MRPHVFPQDLMAAYREMAAAESREREALEWAEATFRDIETAPRPWTAGVD